MEDFYELAEAKLRISPKIQLNDLYKYLHSRGHKIYHDGHHHYAKTPKEKLSITF